MKKLIILAKVLALVAVMGGTGVAVNACNTIEGAGEDVSAAGRGVSRGARDVKESM